MWFEFHQNNSGGHFVINEDKGIGPRVWIEADSANLANDIAFGIGIYFDGVEKGLDCPCCGDRWHEAWQEYEAPVINTLYDLNWHPAVFLHMKDGLYRVTQDDLDGINMVVDTPLRQELFYFLADGSEQMTRVWRYKHTLYGEVVPNFLMGPE